MRLIVFGASGQCGSHIVRLAAQRHHQILAIVRAATRYEPPPNVSVSRGDVLDPSFAASILPGHDAVVSALGIRYAHPWAARRSPDDFISRVTTHIVAGMRAAGVRRIVAISAAGVGDSRPSLNLVMRALVVTSNVGVAYADLTRVEQILGDSGLDWQAVRPTTLTNRQATGPARLTASFPMTASIPRETVAQFIVDQVEQPTLVVRTPMITGT